MKLKPIRIEGGIAYVTLTRGYTAIIDAADAPLVAGFNWSAMTTSGLIYAQRKDYSSDKPRTVLMHRAIMDEPNGLEIDHIDCNGINNQRANLRVATRSQNMCNRRLSGKNSSGLKGVTWYKRGGKWAAQIFANKQRIHLGYHATPEAAHEAYAEASARLHGDFGRLS